MAKVADIGSKRLVSLAPNAWLHWVMGRSDVVARDILTSDFQWVSRASDVLVRAHSPRLGEFLVLNEVESNYTNAMPRRVNAYAGLAEERYNLPVFAVLINVWPPPSTVTVEHSYRRSFLGQRTRRDYHVINLWEVDAERAFEPALRALLPFVPALRGGTEQTVIRRALNTLRDDAELRDLETLLGFLAGFVLDVNFIMQNMRIDMAILRTSPWYQEAFDKGIDQGELRKGQRMLRLMLAARFGELPAAVTERLNKITSDQADALVQVVMRAASLAEFLAHLPTPESPPAEVSAPPEE